MNLINANKKGYVTLGSVATACKSSSREIYGLIPSIKEYGCNFRNRNGWRWIVKEAHAHRLIARMQSGYGKPVSKTTSTTTEKLNREIVKVMAVPRSKRVVAKVKPKAGYFGKLVGAFLGRL